MGAPTDGGCAHQAVRRGSPERPTAHQVDGSAKTTPAKRPNRVGANTYPWTTSRYTIVSVPSHVDHDAYLATSATYRGPATRRRVATATHHSPFAFHYLMPE
jgi:hypothetical protein